MEVGDNGDDTLKSRIDGGDSNHVDDGDVDANRSGLRFITILKLRMRNPFRSGPYHSRQHHH